MVAETDKSIHNDSTIRNIGFIKIEEIISKKEMGGFGTSIADRNRVPF